MSFTIFFALIGSGLLVGFINTLAGSGTVISISLLMFLGLPPSIANGTNRVAVFFQTIVAVKGFAKEKVLDWKKGLLFGIPTVVGSIVGAIIAVKIDEQVMEKIIGVTMLLLLATLFYKPEAWTKGNKEKTERKITILQVLLYFAIGVYGGFIHLGVGIFILAITVLNAGYDLVKANALKNLLVLLYTPFALVIYIWNGMVYFKYGLIHSIGNMIGAYLATKYALNWGTKFTRWVLIIVIIAASFKFLGAYELLKKLILG